MNRCCVCSIVTLEAEFRRTWIVSPMAMPQNVCGTVGRSSPITEHVSPLISAGVILASTNDALSTARLALHEGRREELREGSPCQGPYLFLTVARSITWWRLYIIIKLVQCELKPPLDVDSFRTDFNSHSPNWFRHRHNKSGFAPRLHLWMQIDAHYFC